MSATVRALRRKIKKTGRTVDIAPETGRDLWHSSTTGTKTEYPAKVEDAQVEEITSGGSTGSGEIVTHNGSRVFVAADLDITPQATITLPDGSEPRIVNIDKQRDRRGNVALTVLEVV